MRKIRLFIADVDQVHVSRLAKCLERHPEIELAGRSGDGLDAYRQIISGRPDVVITDIPLPGIDGIMLLKDLSRAPHPPVSIVCTHFYSDSCILQANACGARYFMYKPLDYSRIPEVIRECWRLSEAPETRTPPADAAMNRLDAVRGLLHGLGIPPRLRGYLYLTELLMRHEDDGIELRNLSKGLYADIAQRMSTTASGVERSLRGVIATAYDRGVLSPFFSGKPTNKEFLQFLIDRMDHPENAPKSDLHECLH